MPNIKPEQAKKLSTFLSTSKGELLTVSVIGTIAYTFAVSLIGFVLSFISQTLYPFSYPFLSSPLHTFLPRIAVSPSLPATLLFGALMTAAVYYFEKNIFYRRFHIILKACFSSIAACVLVFVSNLISALAEASGLGAVAFFLYSTEVSELPLLFLYYFLISIPVFALCDAIRRKIFGLP